MDCRALEEAAHEFVRVPSDRVGALDAGEFVAQLLRQQTATAPRGVDVEPEVVLGADVGDGTHRVEGAQDGGAAGAVDVEGPVAGSEPLDNKSLELVDPHPAALVASHLDDIVHAQAAGGAGPLARVVALLGSAVVGRRLVGGLARRAELRAGTTHMLRGEHDQLALEAPHAARLVLWKHLVAGHNHRVEVRDGPAGRQDGVAVGEADYVAHLLEDEVLHQDEDGRDLVGEPVGAAARVRASGSGRGAGPPFPVGAASGTLTCSCWRPL